MTNRAAYFDGLRAGLPFTIVIVPFAMLFGVLATEAGLDILQTMAMTSLVIAGASQFTALQLMQDQAPVLIVLATSLAVNMRMAMYSASMATHIGKAPLWQRALVAYLLVDQTYGISIQRFQEGTALSWRGKLAFFMGTATPIIPLWYGFTWVGAVAGAAIPPEYALDFAIPITFIALIAPQLKSLAHITAALVSVTGALLLVWVPYNLGLMIAALLAMLAGALVETRMEASAP